MNTPFQIPNDMTEDERALMEVVMMLLGAIFAQRSITGAPDPLMNIFVQIAGERLQGVIGNQPFEVSSLIDYATEQISNRQ
ncbi:MAG: hypothetical protein ACYTBJ_18745 [Planctomycetota bacterium]|jgi:hypothetical protein